MKEEATTQLSLHERKKLKDPDFLAKHNAYHRQYFANNVEKLREYNRLYHRRYRALQRAKKQLNTNDKED